MQLLPATMPSFEPWVRYWDESGQRAAPLRLSEERFSYRVEFPTEPTETTPGEIVANAIFEMRCPHCIATTLTPGQRAVRDGRAWSPRHLRCVLAHRVSERLAAARGAASRTVSRTRANAPRSSIANRGTRRRLTSAAGGTENAPVRIQVRVKNQLADSEGFEPPIRLPVLLISRHLGRPHHTAVTTTAPAENDARSGGFRMCGACDGQRSVRVASTPSTTPAALR
jgi:hypothetical protein